MKFTYGQDRLTPLKALQLARREVKADISINKLKESAASVQQIVKNKNAVYGINTGFGPLCQTSISESETVKLQNNILRSHSVGVGEMVPVEVARLMMVLKAQALCFGYSGVSVETVQRILWHVENDVVPVVPSQGSLGASGDLAPLAHLFLPLIGLGKVVVDGKVRKTDIVHKEHGLDPIKLGPKEGLALINGTQFIAAHAVKVVERMHNCLDAADIIGALSLEAMLGSVQPFHEKLHDLRPFSGAQHVASRLRSLLENSEVLASHEDCDRVQDPYSLRCMPQVHGASRDAWAHLNQQTLTEINSVTDNPVIMNGETAISGGNFHGQPLALPLDYATLAAHEIGSISERRTYLLLEGKAGLPMLLMNDTGINSGFMIPQYTAAALVSENKSFCFPASADSIPTSLGQEDHVSMGSISGRKAYHVVDNVEKILAVELLCAAQAFDFRRPLKSSKTLEACHDLVRSKIAHADDDRIFGEDIEVARDIIANGELVKAATESARKNKVNLVGDSDELFRFS